MFVEHKEVGEDKKLDDASKVLLKAADMIERNGWCQGAAYLDFVKGSKGPMCMYGAIWAANDDDPTGKFEALKAAEGRVNEACGTFMAKWNDKSGRTKDEVLAKLRAVALGG